MVHVVARLAGADGFCHGVEFSLGLFEAAADFLFVGEIEHGSPHIGHTHAEESVERPAAIAGYAMGKGADLSRRGAVGGYEEAIAIALDAKSLQQAFYHTRKSPEISGHNETEGFVSVERQRNLCIGVFF